MNKLHHINALWPTLIGEFYNPEHENTKEDLLIFFDSYMKNNPSRKSGENYKLYESQYNIHLQGNEYFKKLAKFMADCFLAMSNEANKKEIEKLKNPNFNVLITDAWFINYQKGGFGYGDAKKELLNYILSHFKNEREKFNHYMNNLGEIDAALNIGANKAKKIAQDVLNRVRQKLGYN